MLSCLQEVLVSVAAPKIVLHDRCVGLISMIGIDAHTEIKKKQQLSQTDIFKSGMVKF